MANWIRRNKIKILIFLVIVIIAIVLVCISIRVDNNKNENIEIPIPEEEQEYLSKWTGKVKDISTLGDYYIIKNCITRFYNNYYYMYTDDNLDNYFSKVIIDLLPNQYIEENNITVDNVKDKFSAIGENEIFILNAYNVTNFNDTNIFIVKFLIREISSNNIFENSVILLCNSTSSTFCIYPNDYVENLEISDLSIGDEFNFDFDVNIVKNSFNKYGSGTKDFDDYAKDVFDSYRKLLLYAPEYAYSLLDEDFKNEKYPTYESFKVFIDNNRTNIFLMTYNTYDSVLGDEYITYTVYDKNTKFYLTFYANSLTNIKYRIDEL